MQVCAACMHAYICVYVYEREREIEPNQVILTFDFYGHKSWQGSSVRFYFILFGENKTSFQIKRKMKGGNNCTKDEYSMFSIQSSLRK